MLAMELMMHTHQDLFRECPIFRLVPPPTALSLVEHFEPVVYARENKQTSERPPSRKLLQLTPATSNVTKHACMRTLQWPCQTGIVLTALVDCAEGAD